MPAPSCTQSRLCLSPLSPTLSASALLQSHPLQRPPEQRFAPARSPHPGPLNTPKAAASSDRASLPLARARSLTCSANSPAQLLPLELWPQSFQFLQFASCSLSSPSWPRFPPDPFPSSLVSFLTKTCPQLLKARCFAGLSRSMPCRFRRSPRTPVSTGLRILKAGSL